MEFQIAVDSVNY